MGSSSSTPSAPPPPPAATPNATPSPEGDGDKAQPKFGWENKVYGGAFKARVQKKYSMIDDMALWRLEARSIRLLEKLEDGAADAVYNQRPYPIPIRGIPEGINLTEQVGFACHRKCIDLWTAYKKCKDKHKSHDACTGWFASYEKGMNECTPKTVLAALQAMMEGDPDPDVNRLRE